MSSDFNASQLNADYEYPFGGASELLKLKVWSKGREIPNYDPNVWRIDICWKLMRYSEHGNTDSNFGWEIDHIYPRAKGGTSEINNLQPLNWRTNRRKSDTYPYYCQ
jgi:hypothetical protein